MTTSDYISIGSLVLAAFAFAYSIAINTKRYELIWQHRSQLLQWYSDTIHILIRLKIETGDGFTDRNFKKELLSRLSSQIEIGRFHFPNVIKEDQYGADKPEANQGYRRLILDLLVLSFNVFSKADVSDADLRNAGKYQEDFTSELFKGLDPKSFLKRTKYHTGALFSSEEIFEDYAKSNPSAIKDYS